MAVGDDEEREECEKEQQLALKTDLAAVAVGLERLVDIAASCCCCCLPHFAFAES